MGKRKLWVQGLLDVMSPRKLSPSPMLRKDPVSPTWGRTPVGITWYNHFAPNIVSRISTYTHTHTGPATPPFPPHGMGPIYMPHMRSSPSPPVVWWGVALSPSPPCGVVGVCYGMLGMYGVYGRSGMACLESMVCLVCMVGMVCMA